MSTIAQQKKLVEQLRMECNMQRKPVSECVKEIMAFMDENNPKDHLLVGFSTKKENPFQEKSGCAIL